MENTPIVQSSIKFVLLGVIAVVLLTWLWPLRSLPTGSRGVITVGGAIKGIESEGFMRVEPWQSLSTFNIHAEEADASKVQSTALAENKDVLELRHIEVEQTKAAKWNRPLPSAVYASAPISFFNAPTGNAK